MENWRGVDSPGTPAIQTLIWRRHGEFTVDTVSSNECDLEFRVGTVKVYKPVNCLTTILDDDSSDWVMTGFIDFRDSD